MNDLISLQNKAMEAILKFQNIESFEDLELWLLNGRGLSQNTYSTYLEAVKQFYTYFNALHPLQWTAAHVEKFYDHVRSKNSISTASLRISGLKKICENIKGQLPFWDNPFDIMPETVQAKLKASEKGKKKKALYKSELTQVIAYLKADNSLMGKQNLAMILTLVTTGLRAQELCNLEYSSIEHDPDSDIWYLGGVGKGDKQFHVEVHPDAVTASQEAYRARFNRAWKAGDFLFYSLENYNGKTPARMNKSTLWVRLRDIGNDLKQQGLIRQELEFSSHLFRRSFLTLLSKEGMRTAALQEHSRHSNMETLINHYVDDHESTRPYLDRILGAA